MRNHPLELTIWMELSKIQYLPEIDKRISAFMGKHKMNQVCDTFERAMWIKRRYILPIGMVLPIFLCIPFNTIKLKSLSFRHSKLIYPLRLKRFKTSFY